ncbi:MAG: hypothetical protein KatS3mg031_0456 [Chitinophagales bacterium]|nr:MAG: hypothetical protein KatS3mg031_0456 [Chitinophagales bacterium]
MKLLMIAILAFCPAIFAWAQSERMRSMLEHGDVVVSSTGRTADGVLERCNTPYSEFMAGVFNEKTETRNVPAILESGIAMVKFDSSNGDVRKGDWVTSSALPGHCMKATQPGFVLGVALENSSPGKLLKVRVQIAWMGY